MPGTRKLGRPSDHRKAMLRGMVTFLLENGRSRPPLLVRRKFAQRQKR